MGSLRAPVVFIMQTRLVQGSSQEVNLYVRVRIKIRSIENNQHQIQLNDHQAGPQWLVRAEERPGSQSIGQGLYQQGTWPNRSMAVVELKTGTPTT